MPENKDSFRKLLQETFPFEPTIQQQRVFEMLADFAFSQVKNELFLLMGFAGTGKTSCIGVFVKNLSKIENKSVLMAPTGRAAKVMSSYSQKQAYTIHRKIYHTLKKKDGGVAFKLAPNKHRNTIFIVDEASMIGDQNEGSSFNSGSSLLDDLLKYVYSGFRCKLILIGDSAQLPPVKLQLSPALDAHLLQTTYDKEIKHFEMSEVVRQEEESGILANATRIRHCINTKTFEGLRFKNSGYKDVIVLSSGYDIKEAIETAYSDDGKEETAVLLRSNKRANLYNQQIRNSILFLDERLAPGDNLMVVRNNYFWLKPNSDAGFIANGDIIEVLEIYAFKEIYDFTFAEVRVKLTDYPDQPAFDTVLLLDTLKSNSPSLNYEENNKLYQKVLEDYAHEKKGYKKFLAVKNNKYFNALQVKFAYAMTCHKSQGGQWNRVFIEQPWLPEGMNYEYLRWLYTAVTRARKKLYLIGFKTNFFVN